MIYFGMEAVSAKSVVDAFPEDGAMSCWKLILTADW